MIAAADGFMFISYLVDLGRQAGLEAGKLSRENIC